MKTFGSNTGKERSKFKISIFVFLDRMLYRSMSTREEKNFLVEQKKFKRKKGKADYVMRHDIGFWIFFEFVCSIRYKRL